MRLFLVAILGSFAALLWAWFSYSAANSEYDTVKRVNADCTQLARKILKSKAKLDGRGVASKSHNYAKNVKQIFDACKIPSGSIRLAGSRTVSTDGKVSKKSIANPIVAEVSLEQIVDLLSASEKSDVNYVVEAIELTAPPTKPVEGKQELWKVTDLKVHFYEATN